jgi:hypothetical protein
VLYPTDGSKSDSHVRDYTPFTSQKTEIVIGPAMITSDLAYREDVSEIK